MTKPKAPLARALTIGAAFLLPAVTVVALPAAPAQAQATAQGGDVAAVSRAIRAITTLKANFEQTDANGKVQSGTLQLKQPGQIRFDYRGGALLIVADGKSLNMIDYDVAQVYRLPVRDSPLGPLLDPNRDLTRYGKAIATGDPRLVSVEVRDPAHPEWGSLTLAFNRKASAPGGLELYGWMAKDAQGNRTVIRLTSLTYGAPIAKNTFTWRDPRPNARGPRR
jgi:outer membrane lipoprotein-sorting protein